jgi:uncharacterized protein (UPF0254 family)
MTTPTTKSTAAKTTAARSRKPAADKTAAPAAAKTTGVKVRLTLVIELPDVAKWEADAKQELSAGPVAEALKAQGIPADLAAEMAAKTIAGVGKTGVNELRDDVRAYVAGEAGKLAKLKAAGATVQLVPSYYHK